MIKEFCDKCGKEITENSYEILIWSRFDKENEEKENIEKSYLYCSKCYKKINL